MDPTPSVPLAAQYEDFCARNGLHLSNDCENSTSKGAIEDQSIDLQ